MRCTILPLVPCQAVRLSNGSKPLTASKRGECCSERYADNRRLLLRRRPLRDQWATCPIVDLLLFKLPSGSRFAVAWLTVKSDGFQFVQGSPSKFRTETNAWRTFCSRCGSSLTYQCDAQEAKGVLDVTHGSLDAPERYPPRFHVFQDERIQWEPLLDGTKPL